MFVSLANYLQFSPITGFNKSVINFNRIVENYDKKIRPNYGGRLKLKNFLVPLSFQIWPVCNQNLNHFSFFEKQ